MCVSVHKRCQCGAHTIQFHLRDNILTGDTICRLFCPNCPGSEAFNPETMLNDNGWIIEYDIQLARMQAATNLALASDTVDPPFIFDCGYAAWLEMYPGEKADIQEEKCRIMEPAKENPKQYLQEIQAWNIDRINRLKQQGWRKALFA